MNENIYIYILRLRETIKEELINYLEWKKVKLMGKCQFFFFKFFFNFLLKLEMGVKTWEAIYLIWIETGLVQLL